MKNLIVIAHLDDLEIGMGGYAQTLSDTFVLCFCHGRGYQKQRVKAFEKNMKTLDFGYKILDYNDMELEKILLKDISKEIEKYIKPNINVYTLNGDIHQDHCIISRATQIACRPDRSGVNLLLQFKIPGNYPFSSEYFDSIYKLNNQEIFNKTNMIQRYKSENICKAETIEYFKTVYRQLRS